MTASVYNETVHYKIVLEFLKNFRVIGNLASVRVLFVYKSINSLFFLKLSSGIFFYLIIW